MATRSPPGARSPAFLPDALSARGCFAYFACSRALAADICGRAAGILQRTETTAGGNARGQEPGDKIRDRGRGWHRERQVRSTTGMVAVGSRICSLRPGSDPPARAVLRPREARLKNFTMLMAAYVKMHIIRFRVCVRRATGCSPPEITRKSPRAACEALLSCILAARSGPTPWPVCK